MTIQFAKAKGRFRTIITDGLDPDEEPDIVPLSGKITLTPNVPYLIDESVEDGDFFGASPFVAEVRAGILSTPDQPLGYLWIVATDSPDINPEGWKYNVTYDLKTPDGRQIVIPAISIVAPTGETLNLSRLVPAANSPAIGTAVAEAAALRAEAALALSVRSVNDTLPDADGNVEVVGSIPQGGWPATSLSDTVQTLLGKADTAMQDLTTAQKASLVKADSASQPGHTHTASQISDSTTIGRSLMTAADQPSARSAIGALGSARQITTSGGLQGGGTLVSDLALSLTAAVLASLAKADSAVQRGSNALDTSDFATSVDTSLGKADTAVQPATMSTALTTKADLVGGVIPTSQLPAIAINDIFTVTSQSAMLALTAQRGDMAIRTDTSSTWVLSTDDPTVLANWKVLPTPSSTGIQSINGITGSSITLAAADVGAVPTGRMINGKALTADITLGVGDISGAAPTASPTFTGTPSGPTATAGTNTTQLATCAFVTGALGLYATLASPTFTGTPTLPTGTVATTQTAGDASTKLATTAFVDSSFAKKASPAFTGTPTAPTATAGTNTTQVATTAFALTTGDNVAATASTITTSTAIPSTGAGTQRYTLGAAQTFTLAAGTAGRSYTQTLILVQDATGGRAVTWPSSIKWAGGTKPTLSTAANAIDLVTLLWTGTEWVGFSGGVAFA